MASLAATKREDLLVDAAMGIVLFKVKHAFDTRKLTWQLDISAHLTGWLPLWNLSLLYLTSVLLSE